MTGDLLNRINAEKKVEEQIVKPATGTSSQETFDFQKRAKTIQEGTENSSSGALQDVSSFFSYVLTYQRELLRFNMEKGFTMEKSYWSYSI